MELSDEQLKQVESFATIGLTPARIAKVLGLDGVAFVVEAENPESQIAKTIEIGRIKAEAARKKALFDQVKEGNITAIQITDKDSEFERIRQIQFEIREGRR